MHPENPTKGPVRIFYRNPLDCIQALLSNPLLASHISFIPWKVWTSAAKICHVYDEWLSGDSACVTTVTTRDSRRPKTHAKPTQVHASGHERVQPPNGTPVSERATRARSLLVLFLLSPFSPYLLYLDSSLSSRLIGIHMYPSALRPSHLTFYD